LTLADLVRDAARRMRAAPLAYGHGTTNARDEAAFLVLRGLRLPFETPGDREATRREQERIAHLLHRRLRERVPTAYLLREAWLAGERFYVDRRAIVPRSHIAQMLAERMRPWLPRAPHRVLDLCTGSGCLAILATKAFPRARVDAADLSRGALEVAARNLALHRLSHRVRLWRSDLLAKLAGERYDLLITNPPYVTKAAMRRLPREFAHEPALALDGGADGLELVRKILSGARDALRPHGMLVCEVGAARQAVQRAFPQTPFVWTQGGAVFVLLRAEMG
jgi:ribosomal protein L3 glutamine methyltransferase